MDVDESRWLSLERRSGETLRAALERTLRQEIRSGALRAGLRLPASRHLAAQLGVSRGVVSDAYGQLGAQGFLMIQPRAAPVVAAVAQREPERPVSHERVREPRYDFTPTTPDVLLFPMRRWLRVADEVARRVPLLAVDYREPQGERELRDAIADHLARTRGVVAESERIVIVQGTAQGVDLVLRVLKERGATRVAVEDPSHTTQHERIRAHGLTLVPRVVDEEGVTVEGLAADAVLVTPAHQFPTGVVLSSDRRRQLLSWAQSCDGLILEDDYDAEFRYDRAPIRALQGIAPESVVQLGTISKTLAPGLRLGWLVLPATYVDDITQAKRLVDDFSPSLDQLTLAEFLKRGDYDRHVRRARGIYRRRRDLVLTALEHELPSCPVEGIAAGMHLLVRLPQEIDDKAIVDAALVRRIRVQALSAFYVQPTQKRGLILGYGRIHEATIGQAVRELADVIRSGST